MDIRNKKLADLLTDYSCELEQGERVFPLAIIQKIYALFACSIFWIAALSVTPLFPPQAARRNFARLRYPKTAGAPVRRCRF